MTLTAPTAPIGRNWANDACAVLGAIATGAVIFAVWPVIVHTVMPGATSAWALVAHVSGMLAGYGVLVMLALMSRWPVLELGVGADRLARWHSRGGRAVLALVLTHAVTAVLGWSAATDTALPLALLRVMGMPWLVAATIGTVLLCAVAVTSIRRARKTLSYERWHAVHLMTYLAIALSFLHQLAGPDLAGILPMQVLWSLLYTFTFALVLRYRVLAPLFAASRHKLRISEVRREVPGVTSIVLKGQHLDELEAQPGQFFRWRFLTPDTWLTAHPFSLSAPPTATSLRLTVKDLGDGSARLQDIEPGTWVIPEGPYGSMTAHRRTRHDVLLIAGGVGITPMRALFETLTLHTDQDLLLLYRADTRDLIVFRDELDQLAEQRGARVIYLLGGSPDLLHPESLRRLVPDVAERDVYLCGPPGFSAAVRRSLTDLDLPEGQLHEERFAF